MNRFFFFVKTFFIGFQNSTKTKLEVETLPTFHQITLEFVEKRGRPKSIAFCRKMWNFSRSVWQKNEDYLSWLNFWSRRWPLWKESFLAFVTRKKYCMLQIHSHCKVLQSCLWYPIGLKHQSWQTVFIVFSYYNSEWDWYFFVSE